MADLPSANELEDWLHELPTGYVDRVNRYDAERPTDPTTFELLVRDTVAVVTLQPHTAPPVELIASTAIDGGTDVISDLAFQSALTQATASIPGWTETVSRHDAHAIDDTPSVVLRTPIYADGFTKHRLLTTLVTLADAASRIKMVGVAATVDDD